MQSLFLESPLDFEKTSAQTQLPEDPNVWPQEVLQELYKQAPYIADFSPHVVMEKVDGEQGYGLGHIEVGNQTEIQAGTSPEMAAASGVRQVRVPVVIKDGMLQPFDLLVSDDSKVLPLTEVRLRAAIFRPQAFDVTSRTPGDQSMIGQLYPPYRQNQGFGGGGTLMNVGMGKEGSALERFLTKTAGDDGHCSKCEGGSNCGCDCQMCKTACMGKTAGVLSDFADPFGSADYLHANAGTKQARAGKRTAEGEHRPGMLDEFIETNKTAGVKSLARRAGQVLSGKRIRSYNKAIGEMKSLESLAKHHPGGTPAQHEAFSKVTKDIRGVVSGHRNKEVAKTVGAYAGIGAAGIGAHHALKSKEKKASILEAILPTIYESDLDAFKRSIIAPELQAALHKNAQTITPFLQLLLEAPVRSKFASVFHHLVQPSVVQLKRMDDGYRLKTASHLYWEPLVQHLERGEAVRRFGEKVVLAADLSGAVTLADGADAMEPPAEEGDADLMGATPVTQPGVYKVRTPEGETRVGYVIPNLIDVDGTSLPLALFMDGETATVQTDIVGIPADGETPDLPEADVPRGKGVFATASGPEGPRATVPLTIDATLAGVGMGEPMSYRAESFTGQDILVSCQPNIQSVSNVDGKMLVPADWKWLPLDHAKEVAVESQEDDLKVASVLRDMDSVHLVSAGGATFSLRGEQVEKLAHDEREQLSIDDTMFMLAALGVDQDYGVRKIAQAITGEAPVRVRVGREIKLASDERVASLDRARSVLEHFPIARQELFKEAAVIGDPQAVDTVLALGFLNPENLHTFIDYLPVLEDAQAKLCDILLASRLGNLIDTPEGAIERAVRSVEAVLEGLKGLAFQNN
jgi:hypothetical protein